jgi:hypothetical protein
MKKNNYWIEDFLITNIKCYEDNQGMYYDIIFSSVNGDSFNIGFRDTDEKLNNLINAALGYVPKKLQECSFLIARLVKGTLFENENRLGEITYNIDYFKAADNCYLADLFFQKYNDQWKDERKEDHKGRLKYVEYVKNNYDYDIGQEMIDEAIGNGAIEE